MQVEEQEGDEADMGGERDGEAEEGEEDDGGEAEGERGVVGEAQGAGEGGEHAATKGSPRRPRGRQGQKPSERGKALHPHPATERAAELKSRASERARAARNASKDEPKAAGEGEGEGRRRRRRGRRHCGGHCILRQLRKQKEKGEPPHALSAPSLCPWHPWPASPPSHRLPILPASSLPPSLALCLRPNVANRPFLSFPLYPTYRGRPLNRLLWPYLATPSVFCPSKAQDPPPSSAAAAELLCGVSIRGPRMGHR